jgi:hypothetical protein
MAIKNIKKILKQSFFSSLIFKKNKKKKKHILKKLASKSKFFFVLIRSNFLGKKTHSGQLEKMQNSARGLI